MKTGLTAHLRENLNHYQQLAWAKKALILLLSVVGAMLVGSLLISALEIFPALSAMRVFKSFQGVTLCAGAVSVFCALAGMIAAILLGTPVGASVVLVDLAVFLVCCGVAKVKAAAR